MEYKISDNLLNLGLPNPLLQGHIIIPLSQSSMGDVHGLIRVSATRFLLTRQFINRMAMHNEVWNQSIYLYHSEKAR